MANCSAQAGNVIDDLRDHSKLCCGRAADLPVVLRFAEEAVMNKAGDPVGEIGKAESADAEELVRGKARDVRAPLFRGQDSVRRMLDSVNIDINVRIDLSGPAADLFRLVD